MCTGRVPLLCTPAARRNLQQGALGLIEASTPGVGANGDGRARPATRCREIRCLECDDINTRIPPVQVKDDAEQPSQGLDRPRAGHKDFV